MKGFSLSPSPLSFFFHFQHGLAIGSSRSAPNAAFVLAINRQTDAGNKKQAFYNIFAAYLLTVPLAELLERVEQARRDAQLKYVVIYGATCSYCLSRAKRLDGSYLRTFAPELREQIAQTLAEFVISILAQPGRLHGEGASEPALRLIMEVLEQVMCRHDVEKLAISVLEV